MYMGADKSLPILEVPNSLIRVDKETIPTFTVPIVPASERIHAFQSIQATIHVKNVTLIDGVCKGNFCGGIEQMKDGVRSTFCPCYTGINNSRRLVLLVDMQVFFEDALVEHKMKQVQVFNFTSHQFTKYFCKNSDIPLGFTESMVNQNRPFMHYMYQQVKNGVEFVNKSGGWVVSGWVRRGYTKDVAVHETSLIEKLGSRAPPPVRVKNSDLSPHITSIEMNKTAGGVFPDLKDFKINFKKRRDTRDGPPSQRQRTDDNHGETQAETV
jgi:hypothetical protein